MFGGYVRMKGKISASLLAQYAYCPRSAWYRAHGIVPKGNGSSKLLKKGKRAHKFFGIFERFYGLWSLIWRAAFLALVGGIALWVYQRLK